MGDHFALRMLTWEPDKIKIIILFHNSFTVICKIQFGILHWVLHLLQCIMGEERCWGVYGSQWSILLPLFSTRLVYLSTWKRPWTYPPPFPASQLLSMQQSPHHASGDVGIDSQQPEAMVVMLQLVQHSLTQRFTSHGFGGLGNDVALYLFPFSRGVLHFLEPGAGGVKGPSGDAEALGVGGGGAGDVKVERSGSTVVITKTGRGKRGTAMPFGEQVRSPEGKKKLISANTKSISNAVFFSNRHIAIISHTYIHTLIWQSLTHLY